MSSSYGNNYKVTIFGESHGAAVGCVVEGIPAGTVIDAAKLQGFLDRRAPGNSSLTSARKEPDKVEILSGLKDGRAVGSPICAIIRNLDQRPEDYEDVMDVPRPGHSDYTAYMKYGEAGDFRGGGHLSGRLTAPLCMAGGIALQLLEKKGICIRADIDEIGGNREEPLKEIESARKAGDSVGGIISCTIEGLPAGIGEPHFYGVEQAISAAVFGIPAVKGIEFGAGFASARLRGSENNDPFVYEDGKVVTESNYHGGILGGITSGMPVTFRVAVKPTPSISVEQRSVSLSKKENTTISVEGRHDPCIVPRALPCVEAAAAMAMLDLLL